MNLYKIHGQGYTRYAGSAGAATKVRMGIAADNVISKNSIVIDAVEILTNKEALLLVLNELAMKADPHPQKGMAAK
jgi:hypothetical protein